MKYVRYNDPEVRFNRTVSILIILMLVFIIFYFITFSWFGESDEEHGIITVGNIAVSVTSDLDFTGVYLEPNTMYERTTTIIGSSTAGDENTSDAYIRVKIVTIATATLRAYEKYIAPQKKPGSVSNFVPHAGQCEWTELNLPKL